MTTFDIISTPNPANPATWTWVADYEASGPWPGGSESHTIVRGRRIPALEADWI